jgi:adenylate cyclase class 1
MLPIRFVQNKKNYLAYNRFRKSIFAEFAPKDSETILYLLPWLLNQNHPQIPGYVPHLSRPIRIYNIQADEDIRKRETIFRNMFHLGKDRPSMRFAPDAWMILGLYTIGSVGTIGQTSQSDCDLWLCVDREQFGEKGMEQLQHKINLIKDWCDANIRMPVYFFISDVDDIRIGNFGDLSRESSGSAQKNILREEFYRTMILISGKIPLWWVAYDPQEPLAYEDLADDYERGVFGDYDFIDLGDLDYIEKDEYFGAALWQFNKALTHPLKSIIKMLLLQMFLTAPPGRLLCHRFREKILQQGEKGLFIDPGTFTMQAILDFNRSKNTDEFEFIQQCFYLRFDMKLYSRKAGMREEIAKDVLQQYSIAREDIFLLNDFSNWRFQDQIVIGNRSITLLLNVYKDIMEMRQDASSRINPRDLSVIGRKLSACLERKEFKIPVIHKPVEAVNQPTLVFRFDGKKWHVAPADDPQAPIVEDADIVYCIAYLVWNAIFATGQVRMLPNPTSITLQEILSLGKRIREVFGSYDISSVDFNHFRTREQVSRMLVVVNFEGTSSGKYIEDFCVLYGNTWGELFQRRFLSPVMFREAFDAQDMKYRHMNIQYYVQRNSFHYDKIIERTKRLLMGIFSPDR